VKPKHKNIVRLCFFIIVVVFPNFSHAYMPENYIPINPYNEKSFIQDTQSQVVNSSSTIMSNSGPVNASSIDTTQPIYQQLVQVYQAILQYQDNRTALQNIALNLNLANACLYASYSDDVAEQYEINAQASVFDTKDKVRVYFEKYLPATEGNYTVIDDQPWTCSVFMGVVDPTIPAKRDLRVRSQHLTKCRQRPQGPETSAETSGSQRPQGQVSTFDKMRKTDGTSIAN